MAWKNYKCAWCGYEFSRYISYVTGNVDPIDKRSKGKKRAVSSQIKCPKCLNFMPTYPKVKYETGHGHIGRVETEVLKK